jgi:4-diphosphocytidyl-2-C-methyl-D-erythritol kinase
MKIRSFAKINLGLEVLGKRPDGYHDIRTLFQAVDFFDVLEFSPSSKGQIILTGNDPSVPWDENNLIFKAARLLQDRYRPSSGVRISVKKNVPPGKGLGGGSSNAAATLWNLDKIWALDLGKEALMDLGRMLGADVAYFLEGGLCLGLERGDKLLPLPELPPLPCLIVLPSFPVMTAKVYGEYRPSLTSAGKDSRIMQFLETRRFGLLENRLETTIFSLYPQLKEIKSLFQSQGPELTLVSGTGSAVFGLFLEEDKARRGLKELEKTSSVLLVKTLTRERYWEKMNAGV